MAADPVFLDTNILVYATVAESPFHQLAKDAIETFEQAEQPLWVSRQVLREYLVILSRPQNFTNPIPTTQLTDQIRHFEQRFRVADEDEINTFRLLELIEQIPVGGKQIHDANIIATMLVYGIPTLLTLNMADFERFHGLVNILGLEHLT